MDIIEPPHVFDMIIYSLNNPKDSMYHESIRSSINARFAKQRSAFLKEFFWYYYPKRRAFLSEENVLVFEWLKSIGVKFL